MATKNQNRCWPGYEPVEGKEPHSQGSCRPKADSKLTDSETEFRAKRKRQLDNWQADHPGARRSAAQHLHAPGGNSKSNAKAGAPETGPKPVASGPKKRK
jgi:hypothetical protein